MYYSKIKSIKKIGIKNTFDLNTPKYENFILNNGILSHNSGKSYSALRLGEELDSEFNMDNVAHGRPKQFMEILNSPKIKRGSVVIFDEAGVGMPAKEWYSMSNKLLNYVLQIFRYKNIIVFFTVPDISYIDSSARKLFHGIFTADNINFTSKRVSLRPLMFQPNPLMAKTYNKYLRIIMDGRVNVLRKLEIGLPSPELIKAYEIKKREFGEWLMQGAEVGARANDRDNFFSKDLTDQQRKIYDLIISGKTYAEIAREMGLAPSTIGATVLQIRMKGFKTPIRQRVTRGMMADKTL